MELLDAANADIVVLLDDLAPLFGVRDLAFIGKVVGKVGRHVGFKQGAEARVVKMLGGVQQEGIKVFNRSEEAEEGFELVLFAAIVILLEGALPVAGQEVFTDQSHEGLEVDSTSCGALVVVVEPGYDTIVSKASDRVGDLFVGRNGLESEVVRAVNLQLAQLALGGFTFMQEWEFVGRRSRTVAPEVDIAQWQVGRAGEESVVSESWAAGERSGIVSWDVIIEAGGGNGVKGESTLMVDDGGSAGSDMAMGIGVAALAWPRV
jgi:hypothetical protein